ncbi:MAG: hypothetical protein ACP5VR_13345, partial [Acidimicrobiales bacterium]
GPPGRAGTAVQPSVINPCPANGESPDVRFLLRDRDAKFAPGFRRCAARRRCKDPTKPRSGRQRERHL